MIPANKSITTDHNFGSVRYCAPFSNRIRAAVFVSLITSIIVLLGGSPIAAQPVDTTKLDPREVWKRPAIFNEISRSGPEDFAISPDHQFLFSGVFSQGRYPNCNCYSDLIVTRASDGDTVGFPTFFELADKCESSDNSVQVINQLNRIILTNCKMIKFVEYPSFEVTATFRTDSGLYNGYIRHSSNGQYFAKKGKSDFVIATDGGDTVMTIPAATINKELLKLDFSGDGSKISLSYITNEIVKNERMLVIEAWDIPSRSRLMRDTTYWVTVAANKIYTYVADAGKIADSGDWMMYTKVYSPPGQSSVATIYEYDVRASKVAKSTKFETGAPGPYGYLMGGSVAYHDDGTTYRFTNTLSSTQVDSLQVRFPGYYPYVIDESSMRCYGRFNNGQNYLFCLQLSMPTSTVPNSQETSAIIVVPNPAQNNLSIIGLDSAESAHIVMTTITGESVFQSDVQVREGTAGISPTLAPGTYALRATTNLGTSFTTMVVVVK
ncbi:MAG: T9SS type A sorting domain-containing protein [Ignavibacteria bacterium]|nr:T9SS type A sorting domain-containing protein [Ignavibacteria bacterium]